MITATLFSDVANAIESLERKFGREQVKKAFNGEKNGVVYRLIAADFLKFDPVQIS